MKQAISVSLGSSTRDKKIEITLLDIPISLERRGTDGDIARATALFTQLDGQIDALGMGGMDLWVQVDEKKYPLYAAHKLVRGVNTTPVVDGGGLKNTLERQVAQTLINELGDTFTRGRVLFTAAVDRYGMACSFFDQGYETVCGDLMFGLGIPIPVRTQSQLRWLARLLMPVVGRLPINFLYPTGSKQEQIIPKFERWYNWATVIAGDCHYIKRHMPADLHGKVIVTNTTTLADLTLFRERGVRYVLTTTPQLNGRSFGTNMMEAALTAVAGKGRPLTTHELQALITQLNMKPTLHDLTI